MDFPHMMGLLNLFKPEGMTSRDVVNRVQRLVRPVKVGHAGTLDPLATGVLVLGLGKATRLIQYVQGRPKRYRGTFELGTVSTTDDREGELTHTENLTDITPEELSLLLPRFTGDISQVPPRFSAVHVKGRRAYDLARKDAEFELEPRMVHIESLTITDWSFPQFTLEIECGSGTYIRSLGRDMGEALGCGAYMTNLVRTSIGEFTCEEAISLADLSMELIEERLTPAGEAVRHLPRAGCRSSDKIDILDGKKFRPQGFENSATHTQDSGPIAVYDESDHLACLAEPVAGTELLQPRQVFLKRG